MSPASGAAHILSRRFGGAHLQVNAKKCRLRQPPEGGCAKAAFGGLKQNLRFSARHSHIGCAIFFIFRRSAAACLSICLPRAKSCCNSAQPAGGRGLYAFIPFLSKKILFENRRAPCASFIGAHQCLGGVPLHFTQRRRPRVYRQAPQFPCFRGTPRPLPPAFSPSRPHTPDRPARVTGLSPCAAMISGFCPVPACYNPSIFSLINTDFSIAFSDSRKEKLLSLNSLPFRNLSFFLRFISPAYRS